MPRTHPRCQDEAGGVQGEGGEWGLAAGGDLTVALGRETATSCCMASRADVLLRD